MKICSNLSVLTPRNLLLAPFGWLYGGIMEVRNHLFSLGVFKRAVFEIPVISVGNLAVGGSGKTPFTKFLIQELEADYKIAVLSRGYGRRTKGYRIVAVDSNAIEVGDEPLEIKLAFPRIVVGVCEDRVLGISELIRDHPEVSLIILDDAYQHQYVKPHFSILLSRANNPFYRDFVMPAGNLREFRHNWKRADAVVFTAANSNFKPEYPLSVPSYTCSNVYGDLQIVHGNPEVDDPKILITGIANPKLLNEDAKRMYNVDVIINYPDHHRYTLNELEELCDRYPDHDWVTTAKDWVKLKNLIEQLESRPAVFVIPVSLAMNKSDEFLSLVRSKIKSLENS